MPVTRDIDRGFRRLRRELRRTKDYHVKVGWIDDKPHPNSSLSVAQVAAQHEFGLGNNPERSTLGASADRNHAKYRSMMKQAYTNVIEGSTVRKELASIGRVARDDVKQAIMEASAPPMEPLTPAYRARKASKGKGKARTYQARRGLIALDTGVDHSLLKDTLTMLRSVKYKVFPV